MDFAGRIGMVTGASRGIGKEIALQLARCGADVAVTSRKQEDVDRVAGAIEALGVRARAYSCDVSSYEDTDALATSVVKDLGAPDFLVNNAGIVIDKLLLRMKPEDWGKVISTNLTGVYNVTKAFAPHFLRRRQGRIVNISSVIGLTGNAGQANYAASKAGIIGLTRSLAQEFGTRGVTVNAVAPGYVTTTMTDGLEEEAKAKLLAMIPMGRLGKVEDVANVVIFLLSSMADYVTGQVINCDGGMVMR
jgi:3-oxoacyl-[acyl-carrier protein] reductase